MSTTTPTSTSVSGAPVPIPAPRLTECLYGSTRLRGELCTSLSWLFRLRLELSFILLRFPQWGAEPTNLGSLTQILFDLIEKTWIPRGSETASLVYGTKGWVTHNEMNAFGHTGMKGGFDGAAIWSNCKSNGLESGTRRDPDDLLSLFRPVPVSSTWLLAHAYDHFVYDPSGGFWRRRGYDMVKVNSSPFSYSSSLGLPLVTVPVHSPTPSFGSTTSSPTRFITTAPSLLPPATVLNSLGS